MASKQTGISLIWYIGSYAEGAPYGDALYFRTNSLSARQEVSLLLRNPRVHYRAPVLPTVYLYQISPAALPSSPTMEEALPYKHQLHFTEMNGVTYQKTMALIRSAMRTLESDIVHYRFHKSPNGVYILRHAYLIFKNFCNIVLSSQLFSVLQTVCCLQCGVRHSFISFVCVLIITANSVEDYIASTDAINNK